MSDRIRRVLRFLKSCKAEISADLKSTAAALGVSVTIATAGAVAVGSIAAGSVSTATTGEVQTIATTVDQFKKDNSHYPGFRAGNQIAATDNSFKFLVSEGGTYPVDYSTALGNAIPNPTTYTVVAGAPTSAGNSGKLPLVSGQTADFDWDVPSAPARYVLCATSTTTGCRPAGVSTGDFTTQHVPDFAGFNHDTIEGHLLRNIINNNSVVTNATNSFVTSLIPGQPNWKNRFATEPGTDHANRKYFINVRELNTKHLADVHGGIETCVLVLSAGENGIIETPSDQPNDKCQIGGDDIAFRIR